MYLQQRISRWCVIMFLFRSDGRDGNGSVSLFTFPTVRTTLCERRHRLNITIHFTTSTLHASYTILYTHKYRISILSVGTKT
jgi:hypothetical protein